MEDRIEKRIEIAAPVARVWRALTDSRHYLRSAARVKRYGRSLHASGIFASRRRLCGVHDRMGLLSGQLAAVLRNRP